LIGLSKFVPSRIVLQDLLFIRLPMPPSIGSARDGEAAFIGLVFKPYEASSN
jgi:hypothetical protein